MLATALTMPSLGVGVVKFGLPLPKPATASAGGGAMVELPVLGVVGPRSEDRAVAEMFRAAGAVPFGRSPIFAEPERAVDPVADEEDDEPEVIAPLPDEPVEIPDFTLSSVMGSPMRPMAVIEGRLRGVGDVVSRGWRVEAISIERSEVVLAFGEHRTVLKLPPRGVIPR